MRSLHGKKALVTGAASGIGRQIAFALAREGVALWLIDIDGAALAVTAEEARRSGVDVVECPCDLCHPSAISEAVRALHARWKTLDILVNNAGIAYFGPLAEMTEEHWNRLIATNLLAPVQLVRELLGTLLARDEANVVNICSALGLVPFRNAAAYQTSKFGLFGFTQALYAEHGRRRFGVSAICPGFVDTPMLAPWLDKLPWWVGRATPEQVARATIRAIKGNRRLVIMTLAARGGWWLTRFSPGLAAWLCRVISR